MTIITLSLVLTTLWMILSPFSLVMIWLTILVFMFFLLIGSLTFLKTFKVPIVLMVIGIAIGSSLATYQLKLYQNALNSLPIENRLAFKIVAIKEHSVIAKIKSDHNTQGFTFQIYLNQSYPFYLNAHYVADVKITPINNQWIPTLFNPYLYSLSHHKIGSGTITNYKTIRLVKPQDFVTKGRLKVKALFTDLGYKNAALMTALTVGLTENITNKEWDLFRKTGTIHLISISGLHLSLVAFSFFILFKWGFGALNIVRPSPFVLAAFVSIFIAIIYATYAGWSIPTQRALIMFSVFMLSMIFNYPLFNFSNLALAGFITVLITPFSILAIGFWLSFGVVALLICLKNLFSKPLWLILTTQLIISVFVMPFSMSFFGEVSIISPIANLIAIPWLTLTILLPIIIGLLLYPISHGLSEWIFMLSNQSFELLIKLLSVLNHFKLSSIKTGYIPLTQSVIISLIVLLAIFYRKKIITLISSTIILLIIIVMPTKNKHINALYIYPVGEGLATFMKTKNFNLIFDTGPYYKGISQSDRLIVPHLQSLNIDALSLIVLSKDNRQHIGGIKSLLRQYPNTNILTIPELVIYNDKSSSCKNFLLNNPTIKIISLETSSSCSLEIITNRYLIWFIGDISIKEWNQLLITHKNIPDILLMPNQGRTRGYQIPQSWKTSVIIHSTRKNHPSYSHHFYTTKNGLIEINLNDLSITQADPKHHYWWYSQ